MNTNNNPWIEEILKENNIKEEDIQYWKLKLESSSSEEKLQDLIKKTETTRAQYYDMITNLNAAYGYVSPELFVNGANGFLWTLDQMINAAKEKDFDKMAASYIMIPLVMTKFLQMYEQECIRLSQQDQDDYDL